MKSRTCFSILLLFFSILVSCSQPAQTPAPSEEMIGPGDKIGDMTVEQGTFDKQTYPNLWAFCEFPFGGLEPATNTSECTVTGTSGLAIELGWSAVNETVLASNMEAITYEWYIDGNKIDLDKFDWEEMNVPDIGPNAKMRLWIIHLANLSPGKHIFRFLTIMETPVDSGFEVYQPGTHEKITNFTVE